MSARGLIDVARRLTATYRAANYWFWEFWGDDRPAVVAALHISLIVAEHLESDSLDSEETIIRLIAVFDVQELADAVT